MGKVRKSNIELLRIVAMFMILVIHANMVSLSPPTSAELIANPLATTTRFFIESLGIVGVDIFVLISGWFLIRSKSFLPLLFQILTWWGGIFFLFLIAGKENLTLKNILEVFMFTRWDWFVKAYVVLMIIAPVLNTYINNSSEKQQRNVLLGFFGFSSTYGWLGGANRFFVNGYGPLLFIGLYLLAHYIHHVINEDDSPVLFSKIITLDKKWDLLIFIGFASINTMVGLIGLYKGISIYSIVYAYSNPVTIAAALYLLLFFSKLEITSNKSVNALATGSFAVYLLHSQVDIRPLFNRAVQYFYNSFDNICCILAIFSFLILIYIVSVVIDIPRLWIWNKISNKYHTK